MGHIDTKAPRESERPSLFMTVLGKKDEWSLKTDLIEEDQALFLFLSFLSIFFFLVYNLRDWSIKSFKQCLNQEIPFLKLDQLVQ